MDKFLNETKTLTALERQLRRIDIQIFKRDLTRRIEAAQPKPAEIPQEKPLPTE